MKRKLVKVGKYSLLVSLPKDWIKKNNLKKGSEVNLELYNNQLFLKTFLNSEKEVILDASKLQPWKQYYISPYYQQNFNKVKINVKDRKTRDLIAKDLWYFPYFKSKISNNKIELYLDKEFSNKKISIEGYLKMALEIVEEFFKLIEEFINTDTKLVYNNKFKELYNTSLKIAEEGTRTINNNCISSDETYLKFLPQFCYYVTLYLKYFIKNESKDIFSKELKNYFNEVLSYFLIVKADFLSENEINFKELGVYKQTVFNEPLRNVNFYDKFSKEEFFYIEKLVTVGRLIYKLSTNISLMLKVQNQNSIY